jgi:3-oxoacyl-[acyl-carrier-protein] synthase-1
VNPHLLEVVNCGMVTSVGLTAPAACVAIQARLANPTPTAFLMGEEGEAIMGHVVSFEDQRRGVPKLARMAAMAAEEALLDVPDNLWPQIPLLLCLAEEARPGRLQGLDDELFGEVQQTLGASFSPESRVIPHGRVSAAVALLQARSLIYESNVPAVLIVATDSMLTWPTLRVMESRGRLLAEDNSNGFMPGEGAAALLVRRPVAGAALVCAGLGFATERAHIDSEEPLRGDGMTQAVKASLLEAGCELHDLDFRIADVSGEQYYFKEAALALGRVLRQHKEQMEIWHPAECIGETGATAGVACLVLALQASRGGYAPGRGVLLHAAADPGQRAAIVAFGR